MKDQLFMNYALQEAEKAMAIDEVPIGAILVDQDGTILARGYNKIEKNSTQLAHAEVLVLQEATEKKQDWRLSGTTLYVTVQPCLMCFGALYLSRVDRVVYGSHSPLFGITLDKDICGGIYKDLSMQIEYLETKEALEILQKFFKNKRKESYVKKGRSRKN